VTNEYIVRSIQTPLHATSQQQKQQQRKQSKPMTMAANMAYT